MNLNFKDRFCKSEHKARFHEASASDWMAEALKAAMLEFMADLPDPKDSLIAASNSWKIQGVKDFIGTFLTLTEEVKPTKTEVKQNLNHKV